MQYLLVISLLVSATILERFSHGQDGGNNKDNAHIKAALESLKPIPAERLSRIGSIHEPEFSDVYYLIGRPSQGRKYTEAGIEFSKSDKDHIHICLINTKETWPGLPKEGEIPILRAELPEVDFASIEQGLAYLTFCGEISKIEKTNKRYTNAIPMAALLDKNMNIVCSHKGVIARNSTEKHGHYYVACKVHPETKYALLVVVQEDWQVLPTQWETENGVTEERAIIPIDLNQLIADQEKKAKKEAEAEKVANEKRKKEQVQKEQAKLRSSMDLHEWTDKDGKFFCRAEFKSYELGKVTLITDNFEYKQVALRDLSKESAAQLRKLIKESRKQEKNK